jgi:hypothetical protein
MTRPAIHTIDYKHKSDELEQALKKAAAGSSRLCITSAPPGSGKTRLLARVASALANRPARFRVAIACQTNSQADDVCRRLVESDPGVPVFRFISGRSTPPDLPDLVQITSDKRELPHGPSLVVATSAKWGLIDLQEPFDILFIDEAWQLAHKNLLLLTQVSERFVLIGDPGQISPVVSVDASRWETAVQAPHRPAPEVMLRLAPNQAARFQLPATWRLPLETAELVRGFYDFEFGAVADPGARRLVLEKRTKDGIDRALHAVSAHTVGALTLPTPASGPPVERDLELAALCAKTVQRVLAESTRVHHDGKTRALAPEQIGIAATHRRMITAIELALPSNLRASVRVDTPERWQGLEVDFMLSVHPLSGVVHPSDFDLDTGRLCVMASRHKAGLLILTRDHIARTLEATIPSARQPVGIDDIAGKGHDQHTRFWSWLAAKQAIHAS